MELPAQISIEENQGNSHVEHNRTSGKANLNYCIDHWNRTDVYQWLSENNVPVQVAKILYNNEVYGASLIHFDKQDLLDIGLSQGPAVHITKIVAKLKTSYHATTKDADALIGTSAAHQFQQETGRAESHTSWSDKQLDQISIEENSDTSSVEIWSRASEDVPRCTGNASHFQDENAVRLEEQYSSMYAKADEQQ
ncbi:uncharacterized protein LOC122353518 isoform X4 [Puntigrus tetrazona]|uniref:uncharacterized protein LOC122353518 isoform X4 n=1 Tax=Puntigrus tetrazona TaxID=1606681 RepID=UPI001C8AB63F|nr:uncharacterized protein LOC122353518 isoform X4 [Puntigrus tetrazona]